MRRTCPYHSRISLPIPSGGRPYSWRIVPDVMAGNGEGQMRFDSVTYTYPPLWGKNAYQPGSSMHRVIKQAQWLKANMPYDKATAERPFLSDEEALDIAAFVNDDELHVRPEVKSFDYPHIAEKAIDYDRGPFVDSFFPGTA